MVVLQDTIIAVTDRQRMLSADNEGIRIARVLKVVHNTGNIGREEVNSL